jgi:glycosyltransferase involved in cell wall biosynthesis
VASVIDCCTPQLVRSIQALLPENEQQKVVHIENATNPMRFNTMDKAACRSRLGLDRFSPVIGYVGGTPAERGGEQIMQTVAKLQAEHPDIAGCVVGGSEQEAQKLRNLAEELQVADRCIIPGQVDYDEVVYWINAFDVGVALDRADRLVNIGSSNQKIRQYLACGLPVVVGKGTSLFIEEHNLGYLVDPDDNDEFISAVSKLINLSTEKKHGIAHIGRQLCQREFSIDAALQKRLKYWESPLNE